VLAGILAAMIAPIVGRYLAALAAQRIYDELKALDQQALDELLARYIEEKP
jgi:hypothetical protein